MKKKLPLIIALAVVLVVAVVAVILFALPGEKKEEKALNIFTWDGYIDYESVIKPFEEKTGIKVNYAPFSSNEEMFKKLEENGASEYDIVLASDYILNASREAGMMQKLNMEAMTNYANLDERFLSQYFDPTNEYVIPYVSGIPLIIYNPAVVDIEIKGFNDLWNEALVDSIGMIDDARVTIGMVLLSMGHSMNTTDEAILAQAKEKLFALKENIHVLEYENLHNALISGDVSVAYTFTPFVALALDANPDFQVVYPEEVIGFGIDGLFIPKNAPHPENANLFLNYLMDAQVAATTVEWQYYCSPNKAALDVVADWFKNNPVFTGIYERMDDGEYILNLGADEAKFHDIWTEFKLLF